MLTVSEVRSLIERTLIKEEGVFAPRDFELSATIYRLSLRGSFLFTLINGGEEEVGFWAPSRHNRYSILLRNLRLLVGAEPAFWFYVIDACDGVSTLSWVRSARLEPNGDLLDAPLDQFEIEPAPTGGGAYLGLIGESAKWLLLHTHYCDEEFEISFHASIDLCNDLCKLVRPRESAVCDRDAPESGDERQDR